jgi:hypothetical protein
MGGGLSLGGLLRGDLTSQRLLAQILAPSGRRVGRGQVGVDVEPIEISSESEDKDEDHWGQQEDDEDDEDEKKGDEERKVTRGSSASSASSGPLRLPLPRHPRTGISSSSNNTEETVEPATGARSSQGPLRNGRTGRVLQAPRRGLRSFSRGLHSLSSSPSSSSSSSSSSSAVAITPATLSAVASSSLASGGNEGSEPPAVVSPGDEASEEAEAEGETASNEKIIEELKRRLRCPICFDQMLDLASTRCGHLFCYPCVTRAVETYKRCPTCRMKLKPVEVHRVYC